MPSETKGEGSLNGTGATTTGPTIPAVSPEKEKKEEKVSVPKATLEAILARLEDVENSNKKLVEEGKLKDSDIEMLKAVSDKGRLAKFEQQSTGQIVRQARVSFWEGNPILAWKLIVDEVGYRDGRLQVKQTVRLFLDAIDSETKALKQVDVEYLFWAQNTQSEPGDVVEKAETDEGTFWTIQLKDGRKIKLDIRFINAF